MARFETYQNAFPNARLTRKPNGVLEVALHTDGGKLVFNGHTHEQFVDQVGYMRFSSDGDRQTTELQRHALLAAGVDDRHLCENKASGACARPAWPRARNRVRQTVTVRGLPLAVVSDNGTELTSTAILRWSQENGQLRDECLNEAVFTSLRQAPAVLAAWREDCDQMGVAATANSAFTIADQTRPCAGSAGVAGSPLIPRTVRTTDATGARLRPSRITVGVPCPGI